MDDTTTYEEELLRPNAVEVLLTITAKLNSNYRDGVQPSVSFPSPWRLAKLVVTERVPLTVFHHGEQP